MPPLVLVVLVSPRPVVRSEFGLGEFAAPEVHSTGGIDLIHLGDGEIDPVVASLGLLVDDSVERVGEFGERGHRL